MRTATHRAFADATAPILVVSRGLLYRVPHGRGRPGSLWSGGRSNMSPTMGAPCSVLGGHPKGAPMRACNGRGMQKANRKCLQHQVQEPCQHGDDDQEREEPHQGSMPWLHNSSCALWLVQAPAAAAGAARVLLLLPGTVCAS